MTPPLNVPVSRLLCFLAAASCLFLRFSALGCPLRSPYKPVSAFVGMEHSQGHEAAHYLAEVFCLFVWLVGWLVCFDMLETVAGDDMWALSSL